MRVLTIGLSVTLSVLGGAAAALAQNVENGQRLAERWCIACHAVGEANSKFNRAPPLAAIAAREGVSGEMIASFLLMPHATMPNFPLRREDARDLAAFIMGMKK